jgi:hypothetical protein
VLTIATGAMTGYVDVLDGRHAAGLARIREAIAESAASHPAPGNHAVCVHVLVEACAAAGDADSGLAAADLSVTSPLWEAQTRRRRAQFAAERSRNAAQEIVHDHDR